MRSLFIGFLSMVLIILAGIGVQVVQRTPWVAGQGIMSNLAMMIFAGISSVALVFPGAAFLILLLALPTWIFLPLVKKFWHPASHQDATDLEDHMHIPEANP